MRGPSPCFEMDLLGTCGRIRISESGYRVERWRAGPSPRYAGYRELLPAPTAASDLRDVTLHAVRDLVRCVVRGTPPRCTGRDALAAIRIGEAHHPVRRAEAPGGRANMTREQVMVAVAGDPGGAAALAPVLQALQRSPIRLPALAVPAGRAGVGARGPAGGAAAVRPPPGCGGAADLRRCGWTAARHLCQRRRLGAGLPGRRACAGRAIVGRPGFLDQLRRTLHLPSAAAICRMDWRSWMSRQGRP
jgi:hypothetical protein